MINGNPSQFEIEIIRKVARDLDANPEQQPRYHGIWDMPRIRVPCSHEHMRMMDLGGHMPLSSELYFSIITLEYQYQYMRYGAPKRMLFGVCPECGTLHWARLQQLKNI